MYHPSTLCCYAHFQGQPCFPLPSNSVVPFRRNNRSDPSFPEKMSRYGEYDSDAGVWISAPCSGDWINPETGLQETRDYEWKNYV